MQIAIILLSALQFALYGRCQLSGPPITPSTLSLSSGSPSTNTSTSTHQSSSSRGPTPTGSAAFPSLSQYPSCVSNCLALGAAAANCTSLVDVNCFCIQSNFTQELYTCVSSTCSSELSSAESLAQQFCNIASASPTLIFPTGSSQISTSSSSQSSSPASSSLPTSTDPPRPSSASSPVLNLQPSSITFWACLATALLTSLSGILSHVY